MAERDEGNSFFRWLVAVGLPLLLLAMFVFHQQTKDSNPQPQEINSQPISDATLTTTIRQAIRDNATLSDDAKKISVESHEGVVTLKGNAASKAERTLIEQIAKNSNGAVKVNNEIEVR